MLDGTAGSGLLIDRESTSQLKDSTSPLTNTSIGRLERGKRDSIIILTELLVLRWRLTV